MAAYSLRAMVWICHDLECIHFLAQLNAFPHRDREVTNAAAKGLPYVVRGDMTELRLILGGQLNPDHSWFRQRSDHVVYVMPELQNYRATSRLYPFSEATPT